MAQRAQQDLSGNSLFTLTFSGTATDQGEARWRLDDPLFALQHIRDAVIVIDSAWRIRQWNRGAEKLYGWLAEEVHDRPITEIIPRFSALEGRSCDVVTVSLLRDLAWQGAVVHIRRDGRRLVVDVSVQMVCDAAGSLIGLVSVHRDISTEATTTASDQPQDDATQQTIEQLQRTSDRLRALVTASQIFAEARLDPQATLAIIVRHVAGLIGDYCVLRLLSQDEKRFESTACYHHHQASHQALLEILQNCQQPSDHGLCGMVIQTGVPVFMPVVSPDQVGMLVQPEFRSFVARMGIRSCIIAPLRLGEKIMGVLVVARDRTPVAYTPDDLALIQSLAQQCAQAIEQARLVAAVCASHDRMSALSRQLITVKESERRMLARELHDEIGQVLTGLSLQLLAIASADLPQRTRERVVNARQQVNALTAQVRNLSLDLRPSMLDDLGLLAALEWYIRRYSAETRIQVFFEPTNLDQAFSPDVRITAYRVVQEALTNVARHAAVGQASVRIWVEQGWLRIRVADSGRGFDPGLQDARATGGISGMQERVALLGGNLTLLTAPGQGTTITVALPLAEGPANQEGCYERAVNSSCR